MPNSNNPATISSALIKEVKRTEERQLIERELDEFWKEKDNYLILIVTNGKGTKRLSYNYENVGQLVTALVTAQMAEMGLYKSQQ